MNYSSPNLPIEMVEVKLLKHALITLLGELWIFPFACLQFFVICLKFCKNVTSLTFQFASFDFALSGELGSELVYRWHHHTLVILTFQMHP